MAAYQGPNLLLYAPGGGVENTGMSQAVNDLLLQSTDGVGGGGGGGQGHIALFPAWPEDEPAAFTSLRAKGAFLVSATWNHVSREVEGLEITAAVAAQCRVVQPWRRLASSARVHAKCRGPGEGSSGESPARYVAMGADEHGMLAWDMEEGETCELRPFWA